MQGKSVLVTGASTGIGRACALDLAARGARVFAGVRREADAHDLRAAAGPNLEPLLLDVTRPEQVEAAARAVGPRLWGLVNNAGVNISGPSEFLPIDQYRRQFEVNFFGQIAVTQVLLPAIREARGRVLFVGSAAGWIATPFQGPYSASKFALEALADSLRMELAPWGIHVALIKPGSIATPIWERARSQAVDAMAGAPPEALRFYEGAMRRMGAAALVIGGRGIAPDRVVAAVRHALTAPRPRTRYLVGREALLARIGRFLPDRLRDAFIARELDRLVASPAGQAASAELDHFRVDS
ncbi:MAG: SDR family oxidoreductase [Candidatus Sericytochromatia bacterium]|nr:SDR family oxidoreductase [Candidatus Tanganyikabacteria bacterium]